MILEDNAVLAEGLHLLLASSGFDVLSTTGAAPEFLAAVAEHEPDLALVDVRLPPTYRDEGVHAALAARRQTPGLAVVLFSQYVEQVYARELFADGTGGVGYLLKERVRSSSPRYVASPGAVRRSTRRWWRSCWSVGTARWRG